LLAFDLELGEPGLRLGFCRRTLCSQALRYRLADITRCSFGREAQHSDSVAGFHPIALLNYHALQRARCLGGCADHALIGNDVAGHRRLARVRCRGGKADGREYSGGQQQPKCLER
jgi:hypothetical protein